MVNRWICSVCFTEFDGSAAPNSCSHCDASAKMIMLQLEPGKEPPGEFVGLPMNLTESRDRARKKLRGVCAVYPWCDGADDRICNKEAYGKPIGLGGAGTGSSFSANIKSLAAIQLRTKLVGEHFTPDTNYNFLGIDLDMPIMGASTSGIGRYTEEIAEYDFCLATVKGCKNKGTISWRGDTHFYTPEDNPGLKALQHIEGYGIPIFKPRANDVLKTLIEKAEQLGCPAVGIDLDGCGSTIMARHGQPVFRKTVKEIQELVSFTKLPLIVKGIMEADDAEACVAAGVKVIAVSNHGGRVLDYTPGVAQVLPSIVERVGKHVIITADGGVRTGYDAIKLLALGADAVLMGRDLIRAAVGGGTRGVEQQLERVKSVLKRAMVMTGCKDIKSINADIVYTSPSSNA